MKSVRVSIFILAGIIAFFTSVPWALGVDQPPVLAHPGMENEVFYNGYTGSMSLVNEITWEFHSSVPLWVQEYILEYWEDLEPVMNEIIGPPSASITVTVEYDPDMWAGGTYSYGNNWLKFSTLPEGYNTRIFNGVFAHETIHAYQDAALEMGWIPWTVEGIAVAGTAIIKEALYPDWLLQQSNRSLDDLSTMYDHLCQMGPEAIGGRSNLASNVSPLYSYVAAGGVFWILTCAQSQALSEDWLNYDYMKTLLQRIYFMNRGLGVEHTLTTIEETAPYAVDGRPARTWVADQPVTVTSVPAGDYIFASLGQPFLSNYYQPLLMYQPFHRYSSGAFTRLYNQPVWIRAYDINNTEVLSMEHTPVYNHYDYQYIQLGEYLRTTPGAYIIEIDASAYGAGTLRLEGQNVVDLNNTDPITHVSRGVGICFFDLPTQGVGNPMFTLKNATLGWSGAGANLAAPNGLEKIPSNFTVRLNAATITSGLFTRTVTLPYRRAIRLDIN